MDDPAIASAFGRLRLDLLEARQCFRTAPDGGRAGAVQALVAILDFFDAFDVGGETPDADLEAVLQPVRALAIALTQLNEGIVHPMLATAKRPGRPRHTHDAAALKALSALAVTILVTTGDKAEPAAREYTARALTKAGHRQPNGSRITAATLKSWRKEALEGDPSANRVACLYQEYLTLPAPPGEMLPRAHADAIIALAAGMLGHLRVR